MFNASGVYYGNQRHLAGSPKMTGLRSFGSNAATAAIDRRRLLALGGGALLATALGGSGAMAQAPGLQFFRIATGPIGATYFPVGDLLAKVISAPVGSRPCDRGGSCGVAGMIGVAQASTGSAENVSLIHANGVESALVQADVAYWALTATGPFAGRPPVGELRAIAALYVEAVHIVVRADAPIASIADLRGRRVSLGEEGSGTRLTARMILDAHGVAETDLTPVPLRLSAAADQLVAGTVDAFVIIGGTPIALVAELAERLPIRLLPVAGGAADGLARGLPAMVETPVAEGVYSGVPETPVVGIGALWVVDADAPDDVVYGITRALWHPNSRRVLDTGHPRGRSIVLATALAGLTVPLHPGALRYYRAVDLPGLAMLDADTGQRTQ
jgi:uncharacterized protein